MLLARELTERVIGLAIEVHPRVKPGDQTGPGMLESVYEGCLCYELEQAWVAFERQAGIPVTYKGVQFDEGFRADILVDRQLIVEIKTVAAIMPAHDAQVLTYLRMSGLRLAPAVQFPCTAVEARPLAICRPEPLRAAPWFFVLSVLNACNRARTANRAAGSHMTDPQHFASPNARAIRVREPRRVPPQTAQH